MGRNNASLCTILVLELLDDEAESSIIRRTDLAQARVGPELPPGGSVHAGEQVFRGRTHESESFVAIHHILGEFDFYFFWCCVKKNRGWGAMPFNSELALTDSKPALLNWI